MFYLKKLLNLETTMNYMRVEAPSEEDISGQIRKVKITGIKEDYVEGVLI